MNKTSVKKMLTKKNITNGLFIVLLAVILFVPTAKAFMMQGLMEIGLYQPNVKTSESAITLDLTSVKFKDNSGKVVNLGALKGKVIFLNFWATWCPPCLAEMPSINKLHQQFMGDKEVVFIMVDADSNLPKAQAYMDRKKYQMPVFAADSEIPEVLFKGSLPTTIVFDKKGRISFQEEGAANYASPKFVSFIKQLKELKD